MIRQESTFNNINETAEYVLAFRRNGDRAQLKIQKQFILFLPFQHMPSLSFFCSSNYGVHSL